MKDYIERERIEKFFDGIYGCAELIFEPNDHCCAEDNCAHCKWYETMNAIRKRILSIPAADVRPVLRGRWRFEKGDGKTCSDGWVCSACNCGFHTNVPYFDDFNFCPNCGADMRGEN